MGFPSSTPAGAAAGANIAVDKDYALINYTVINAFTGASLNDVISLEQTKNQETNAIVTVWRNQNTGQILETPPLATNVQIVGSFMPAIGHTTDATASSDTGSFSLISLIKRVSQTLTSLLSYFTPPSEAHVTALSSSLIAKATGGTLLSIAGYNDSNADQFIHVYNSATLPADGASGASIPVISFLAKAKDNFSYSVDTLGQPFSTGIVVGNSSTAAVKTIGGEDCWFNVRYRL